MGFRNPFRFTVDPETGWVLMGDYGPDASSTNANRGPQGSVEYNAITSAGNYGWPYCIRDNTPYNDYDFATSTSGPKFDCANLTNTSPNNTGLTTLPPARGATAWMGFNDQDPRFTPALGTGGAPMGGPRYHFDPTLASPRKFPAFYDDKWFIGEWNNGWIKTADLNASGAMTGVQNFALGTGYRRPMDLDFGPDGALYVIEWGSGFNGNNADSGVYRVDYLKGDQNPVARADRDADRGPRAAVGELLERGLERPRRHGAHVRVGLRRRRHLDGGQPVAHLHHQRRLPGQAHRHRRGRPDRRRQHRRHRRQPHAAGHDRVPRERPDRVASPTRSATGSASPTPRTGRPAPASAAPTSG